MIRDRGAKKWVSLMLPEHRERLAHQARQQEQVEVPNWADDYLEELEWKLKQAYAEALLVKVNYVENGEYHETEGGIIGIDPVRAAIHLQGEAGHTLWLPVRQIVALHWR